MPPKNKMTTKMCPDCDNPCAVACKTCSCGYSFYQARRGDGASTSASTSADGGEDGGVRQRRTQRIKEKPNYYDATEFMKEKRKRRRRNDDQYELRRGSGSEPATAGAGALRRRKKRKGGRGAPKEEEEEEEEVVMPIGISPEKQAQCDVILADLNRRIQSTAVRVR